MFPKIRWNNRKLYLEQSPLVEGALEESSLASDAAVGTSMVLVNANRFAASTNILVNPFGETAEFLKIGSVSGNTLTLSATSLFQHYAGEKVYLVQYNQIEFAHATTTTGTKTALTTSVGNGLFALEGDNQTLTYSEPEYNSGYYFGRFVNNIGAAYTISGATFTSAAHGLVNGDTVKLIAATTMPTGLSTTIVYYVVSSATNTFSVSLTNGGAAITPSDSGTGTLTWYKCSLYSDPIQYGTWDRSTVGYMIDRGLRDLELTISEKVSLWDCYEWTTEGLKEIQGKLKRWPEHYVYNAVLGQVTRGNNVIAMPSDAYDTETNKSLIALRIGTGRNLFYLTPVEFDAQQWNVSKTQVTTQATAGQTTLEIDNSYDFEDSGTVSLYVSGTKYSLTYTGVTRSATAGILTGIPASGTGSISVTIPVDTYVWQNEREGIPTEFTVRNGNIEYWPLADSTEDNTNLYGDYSKVATVVDSDSDTIDYQRYDMLQSYLTWRMWCKARNNGVLDMENGFYMKYKEKLNDAIRTLAQNNKFPMRPTLNRMNKRGGFRASLQDIPLDQQ